MTDHVQRIEAEDAELEQRWRQQQEAKGRLEQEVTRLSALLDARTRERDDALRKVESYSAALEAAKAAHFTDMEMVNKLHAEQAPLRLRVAALEQQLADGRETARLARVHVATQTPISSGRQFKETVMALLARLDAFARGETVTRGGGERK